ncbi:MAG: AAA family ATPase [Planctomycetes bacterium]|nr:AAA family ATPase [Planctomycetota bacterium]MBL7039707.1 AAA family ATPase [Pirellulaceae bacterium]
MSATITQEISKELLSTLLSDDTFWPTEPRSMKETGLSEGFIESLVCKFLGHTGTSSGRRIADALCLPFGVIESLLASLRAKQVVVHAGSAAFNDYYYTLSEQGRRRARAYADACAYVGPAPVPLMDYVIAVEAQAVSAESPRRHQLEEAFGDITINSDIFELLGPAVNSGAGMFLYGAPGNGKSTLAKRITLCFGQEVWIPHAILEDANVIKLYDASYHHEVKGHSNGLIKLREHDRRWMKIRRPTVVVGGELTMDNLEIRHDPHSNVSEAPIQMKSNCGCLLIDDFGRQRIAPEDLLNRWIVPLESRHDYLTLSTGKKIQVPFEQLIIFSTNLEPEDLVDEAFLRRIPYKIEISDPDVEEFHILFELYADQFRCEYRKDIVDQVIAQHYEAAGRPLRRCHPRDLLSQIRAYCSYNDLPLEMRPEYFDRAARSYFATVLRGK